MSENTLALHEEINELWETATLTGIKRDLIDLEGQLNNLGDQSLMLLNQDVHCYETEPDIDLPLIQLLDISKRLYHLKEYAKHSFESDFINSLPDETVELESTKTVVTNAA